MLNEENDKYDVLQKEFDSRVKELLSTGSQRDVEHQKVCGHYVASIYSSYVAIM